MEGIVNMKTLVAIGLSAAYLISSATTLSAQVASGNIVGYTTGANGKTESLHLANDDDTLSDAPSSKNKGKDKYQPAQNHLTQGDYTYTTNAGGKATITRFNDKYSGALYIPKTLGEHPVISIGDHAFYGCHNLTTVTIPDSVINISKDAFTSCGGLSSVTIPGSVTSIGKPAFSQLGSLTNISVASANSAYFSADGVLFNKDQTTLIRFPARKYGGYTIPNSVTSIEEVAFSDCKGLNAVTIPSSVTSIGSSAFAGCASLTTVTIPFSVTSFQWGPFANCGRLKAITVDAANTAFISADGVLFTKDQTTLIQFPAGKKGGYTIPNSVNAIGEEAFFCCGKLTSVIIPGSVTNIGDSAFGRCTGLASVTIPNSVTAVGSGTFSGCGNLASVIIPASVTHIGDTAFSYCDSLTDVTIPAAVISIGASAFSCCNGLDRVTIPGKVARLGCAVFASCPNLTAVYFGGNAPAVDQELPVFMGSKKTTVYHLPGTTGWGEKFGGRVTALWK